MKSTLIRRLALAAAASTLFACGLASAQATGGPSSGEGTPPNAGAPAEQAAIDACKDKKEGDRVRFTTAKGKKRHWTCAQGPEGLAARAGIATPAVKK